MEDAGFMKVGSAGVMYEKLKSRVGPKERKEGVMIDEEGFRLGGRWRYKSGPCRKSV